MPALPDDKLVICYAHSTEAYQVPGADWDECCRVIGGNAWDVECVWSRVAGDITEYPQDVVQQRCDEFYEDIRQERRHNDSLRRAG